MTLTPSQIGSERQAEEDPKALLESVLGPLKTRATDSEFWAEVSVAFTKKIIGELKSILPDELTEHPNRVTLKQVGDALETIISSIREEPTEAGLSNLVTIERTLREASRELARANEFRSLLRGEALRSTSWFDPESESFGEFRIVSVERRSENPPLRYLTWPPADGDEEQARIEIPENVSFIRCGEKGYVVRPDGTSGTLCELLGVGSLFHSEYARKLDRFSSSLEALPLRQGEELAVRFRVPGRYSYRKALSHIPIPTENVEECDHLVIAKTDSGSVSRVICSTGNSIPFPSDPAVTAKNLECLEVVGGKVAFLTSDGTFGLVKNGEIINGGRLTKGDSDSLNLGSAVPICVEDSVGLYFPRSSRTQGKRFLVSGEDGRIAELESGCELALGHPSDPHIQRLLTWPDGAEEKMFMRPLRFKNGFVDMESDPVSVVVHEGNDVRTYQLAALQSHAGTQYIRFLKGDIFSSGTVAVVETAVESESGLEFGNGPLHLLTTRHLVEELPKLIPLDASRGAKEVEDVKIFSNAQQNKPVVAVHTKPEGGKSVTQWFNRDGNILAEIELSGEENSGYWFADYFATDEYQLAAVASGDNYRFVITPQDQAQGQEKEPPVLLSEKCYPRLVGVAGRTFLVKANESGVVELKEIVSGRLENLDSFGFASTDWYKALSYSERLKFLSLPYAASAENSGTEEARVLLRVGRSALELAI